MIYKKNEKFEIGSFTGAVIILAMICCLSVVSFGQTDVMAQSDVKKSSVQEEKPAVLQPVFTEYKGITIGTPAEEVRDKIDKKPKIEDKDGFYYVFSDNEAMQIVLDEDKKVKVISIFYSGENSAAPTYEAVLGRDIPPETASDGKIYKLVRYPLAGFWVAYSRSAGEHPPISLTIQKMWNVQ